MAELLQDTCLQCGAVLPEGTACCPRCDTQMVFCFRQECGRPYPAVLLFCPDCATPNELAGRFGSPPAAEPVAPASQPSALSALPPLPPLTLPPASGSEPAEIVHSVLRSLAETVGSAGGPSVAVEVESGPVPQRGQQSLLVLRVCAPGLTEQSVVKVRVEAEEWPAPVTLSARLAPGEQRVLPGIHFVPAHAGFVQLSLTATLESNARLPTGRWLATYTVLVEEAARESAAPITATGGAVVIVSNPTPFAPLVARPALPATWQPLYMRPATAYLRRLPHTCPAADLPQPPTPEGVRSATGGGAARGELRYTDLSTGASRTIAFLRGAAARFGPGAARFTPAPPDTGTGTRPAGTLAVIELHGGRAWVIDRGSLTVQLNADRLPKDVPEILADGDLLEVDPRSALRVSLVADEGEVHAAWFDLGATVAEPSLSLLACGRKAVPFPPAEARSPALWLAWVGEGAAAQLAVRATEGGAWIHLPAEREQTVAGYRLLWCLGEQEEAEVAFRPGRRPEPRPAEPESNRQDIIIRRREAGQIRITRRAGPPRGGT